MNVLASVVLLLRRSSSSVAISWLAVVVYNMYLLVERLEFIHTTLISIWDHLLHTPVVADHIFWFLLPCSFKSTIMITPPRSACLLHVVVHRLSSS